MTDTPEQLLDSNQLAAWLGVSIATLNAWAYEGRGPAFVKVGRQRRYRRETVDRWLDEQTVETASR